MFTVGSLKCEVFFQRNYLPSTIWNYPFLGISRWELEVGQPTVESGQTGSYNTGSKDLSLSVPACLCLNIISFVKRTIYLFVHYFLAYLNQFCL